MNVGVVSLALAWIVGVYIGGMRYNDVIGTFPVQLFLTLAGVTLLFGMATVNGTLQRLAARAVTLCRGNAGVIPVMFFLVALLLSSIGPGNIATAAMLAPMAMAVGAQARRAAVPHARSWSATAPRPAPCRRSRPPASSSTASWSASASAGTSWTTYGTT